MEKYRVVKYKNHTSGGYLYILRPEESGVVSRHRASGSIPFGTSVEDLKTRLNVMIAATEEKCVKSREDLHEELLDLEREFDSYLSKIEEFCERNTLPKREFNKLEKLGFSVLQNIRNKLKRT